MKSLLAALTLIGAAQATTISVGGGVAAALWVTAQGITLTNLNSSFAIGTYDGTIFTQFAPTDATPMAIGTVAATLGRLTGNFSDTTNAATAFNGQIITYRVSVNFGGLQSVSYFAGPEVGVQFPGVPTKFPVNGFGAGDSLAAETRNLTILGAGSHIYARAWNGTNIIAGGIPEPATSFLGLLGVAGLIRRRR
jgi:hypothetical protein